MARKPRSTKATNPTPRATYAHYDLDQVKSYARGQWVSIYGSLAGIDPSYLDGKHHSCPICKDGKDCFRMIDEEAGAIYCNKCFTRGNGDGIAGIGHATGRKFAEALAAIADHLGIEPTQGFTANNRSAKPKADPSEKLVFQEWNESNDLLAEYWCIWKKPITVAAIKRCGGLPARYRDRFTVLAFPVHGDGLSAIAGWTLYNMTGGPLPTYAKNKEGKWEERLEKVLTTYGSKSGILGPVNELATAKEIWKVEGLSDLLAFYSLGDLPPDVAAITNNCGAGEKPTKWMLELFSGKTAVVVHDADLPGQRGATGHRDKQGKWHRGWCGYLHGVAGKVVNVQLPFTVEESHGKDLRDYLRGDLA